jgi:hypothetical protein
MMCCCQQCQQCLHNLNGENEEDISAHIDLNYAKTFSSSESDIANLDSSDDLQSLINVQVKYLCISIMSSQRLVLERMAFDVNQKTPTN